MFGDVWAAMERSLGGGLGVVVGIAAALLAALILLWVVTGIRAIIRRHLASRQLGIRVPRGFRVGRAKVVRDRGAFVLVYPRWQAARNCGTPQ